MNCCKVDNCATTNNGYGFAFILVLFILLVIIGACWAR